MTRAVADAPAVTRPAARPTYGIDAPNILIGLTAAAVFMLLVGFFFAAGRSAAFGAAPWLVAAVLAAGAIWVAHGSRRAKPRRWRRALDDLGLSGSEQALDLGCGRGLVLIETALRLPDGHATGVDIWRNRDQSGNRRATTELNARIEGVAERVTIRDADMTRLPFEAASFDLVTASFSIRSLALADERRRALDEAVRVLRPGGRLLVLDDTHTAEIAAHLHERGLGEVVRSSLLLGFGPPARLVSATRR
jgi:SAM-dependent methyltransferase